MGTPVSDMSKVREVPNTVDLGVELDSPLGLVKDGLVKQRDARFNHCGIKAEEPVSEAELYLGRSKLRVFLKAGRKRSRRA